MRYAERFFHGLANTSRTKIEAEVTAEQKTCFYETFSAQDKENSISVYNAKKRCDFFFV